MKKIHRYLLMQGKGQSKKLIKTSNDPEALENAAQRFNEQANGCTYFVIDKLNPPLNERRKDLEPL